ncbi:MAG: ATP-binding protein [Xenococcaceae cyanobacterium MO_188.B29]|nr:ATP-binding protein [Xenococcaceae cyanobacterium MO_188.B29]
MTDNILTSELANSNGFNSNVEPSTTEIDRATTSQIIGKVASPPRRESTSDEFHFWVKRGELVEKTQIVKTESRIGDKTIEFYAIVEEVYRQSRKRDIGEEFDAFDGDVNYQPEFHSEGVTFATASILRTNPPLLAPPLEQSSVYLGSEDDAQLAYRFDEIKNPLPVGLIKNGGNAVAGTGVIDLDYLLGKNGGHMNINGIAGRGTKSSFLLFTVYQLLKEARDRAREKPSDPNPLMIVPIILNVKGYDLFHIDKWSQEYEVSKHNSDWQVLGIDNPEPFSNVSFYAPQMPGGVTSVPTGRNDTVQAYSWSLGNIIEKGLFPYLFADDESINDNFRALVLDIEAYLTKEIIQNDGNIIFSLKPGSPQTFQKLLEWLDDEDNRQNYFHSHHLATWRKLRRKLGLLINEGNGVLRRDDCNGNPLDLGLRNTSDPIVIDLNSLAKVPSLQRFVVATIFQQLVRERTGTNRVNGLVYLVALDELNRFAPRGSKDPITKLIETVAAEMRSQGIILLGAQQQASKVSDRVIENASIRVLGRSGSLELSQSVWRSLSKSAQRKATELAVNEKMIIQDNEPMYVRFPLPPWAMNPSEVDNSRDVTSMEDDEGDIETF